MLNFFVSTNYLFLTSSGFLNRVKDTRTTFECQAFVKTLTLYKTIKTDFFYQFGIINVLVEEFLKYKYE